MISLRRERHHNPYWETGEEHLLRDVEVAGYRVEHHPCVRQLLRRGKDRHINITVPDQVHLEGFPLSAMEDPDLVPAFACLRNQLELR